MKYPCLYVSILELNMLDDFYPVLVKSTSISPLSCLLTWKGIQKGMMLSLGGPC